MTKGIGPARAGELDQLAEIWHDSWHFAHRDIVDPDLVAARTPELFSKRIDGHAENTICARIDCQPAGLAILKDEELHQFFISKRGRGTGIAYRLMQITLDRFAEKGVEQPHLYVAEQNDHAIGFYKRTGWTVDRHEIENIRVGQQSFKLPALVMTRQSRIL